MTKFRSLIKFAGLLVAGLQISGMTAFAEDARSSQDAWTIKNGPRDTLVVEPFVDPSKSKLPLPSQKALDDILSSLKRVRVIDCGMDLGGNTFSGGFNMGLGEPYSGKIVFESSDPKVLKEITEHLRIRESPYTRVLGPSAPTFEFTLVDGKVVHIGLAGWSTIRWKAWRYDAFLLNPKGFIDWLTNHEITGPIREIKAQGEYERLHDQRLKAALGELVKTMPKSLRDFFGTLRGSSCSIEDLSEKYRKIPDENRLKMARLALSRQYPSESDQIAVLLAWQGKITSTWEASFQNFPIELLLEYDPSQVLSKIKQSSLSPVQWVGVNRYYYYPGFRRKFPSGCNLLAIRRKASLDEFVRTMPTSLCGFFGSLQGSGYTLEDLSKKYMNIPDYRRLKLARSALSRQFPNESDQIGVLLEWNGKLTDMWEESFQGFPSELLRDYDQNQVLSTVKGSSLSPTQWVGLSRHYFSLYFRRNFPSGYKPLDKPLRERILKEVKATGKNQLDVDLFKESMRNWTPPY